MMTTMNDQTAAIVWEISRVLGSDYRDLRPLGKKGGFSSLFVAHKINLDVDVVIKRMAIDPREPELVKNEAQVMTQLRHQYLPRIYDVVPDGKGWFYTIMELIPGCTLRDFVNRNGALSQKQTYKWMRQISQAVQYMHSKKIIHSDIKPENIMITPEGDVCLIDFNASLQLKKGDLEAIGVTQYYAAPEQYNVPPQSFGEVTESRRELYETVLQAQGYGKVSERTDIYAIGAVTYFMITGYNPNCWNREIIPLDRYDISLSDPLRLIIERCMQTHQRNRYQSCGELLKALGRVVVSEKEYRRWRHKCQIAVFVVCAGMMLSAFAAFRGYMMLSDRSAEEYNSMILTAQEYMQNSDYDKAEEILLEAIGLDRSRPEAYANIGAVLYRMGDYQQAESLLTELKIVDEEKIATQSSAEAYGQLQYVLGACRYQLEKYPEALEAYQLATFFCPDNAAYTRDLAVCYAKAGYSDKAVETAQILSALNPRNGDVDFVMGEIAYASGDYEQACEKLAAAAVSSDDHEVIRRASIQAARCCQRLGDSWTDKEIEILEGAYRRLESYENAYHLQLLAEAEIYRAGLGGSGSEDGYTRALGYLDELVNRGQAVYAVRQNRALVLEYLDRFAEAEEELLKLEADFPNDYRPPMRLALLYADMKSSTGAAADFDYDGNITEWYEEAKKLYNSSESDAEMARLEEIVSAINGG